MRILLIHIVLIVYSAMAFSQNNDRMMNKTEDEALMDLVQKASFDYFWNEANTETGLIKDRSTTDSPASIASTGFGITAICIGIERGWITREEGKERINRTLKTFWEKPQGSYASGYIGNKGFFYHFLNMSTGSRTWNCELSSIDTGLLLAGIIFAKEYFTNDEQTENNIRKLADSIYYRIDWQWMRNLSPGLIMGWSPEKGFSDFPRWNGYNEAMILYILALGSPYKPAYELDWKFWINSYSMQTHYGYTFINFPPLFGHQYSHCWIDFRGIKDDYMRSLGFELDYFENSKRATLAQREYSIQNPKNFQGYGENVWGITASDYPGGYIARGAPPAMNDDGTIAPTAAISSMPFTPIESMNAMKYMYNTYKENIWTKYGFRDAFNISKNWWGPDIVGIDQGPIIIMIENYRTGLVWKTFMKNRDVQRGLLRAGFDNVNSVKEPEAIPADFVLEQNYPNPFNNGTVIKFRLTKAGKVFLKVSDVLGNEVKTLADEVLQAGEHSCFFSCNNLSSGTYLYSLEVDGNISVKKMLYLR